MPSEFVRSFLKDSTESLRVFRRSLENLSSESDLSEAARALHSLKSGAAFLGWDELEKESHRLEDILASAHTDEDLRAAADGLEDLVAFHAASLAPVPAAETASAPVHFSALERGILSESEARREHFYRLICRIDPSEPMPFSRAFLLSARLETDMTLVKTLPAMEDESADFSRITFWITSEGSESELYAASDVDLVTVESLTRLEYQDVGSDGNLPEPPAAPVRQDVPMAVDRTYYTQAVEVAEELAWRLERRPGSPEASLAIDLQRTLEELAFRPMEPLLSDIAASADRLAERRGLQASFTWQVESAALDAATLGTVGEILMQLVRNSLRHGIEDPIDRSAAGKSPKGMLKLDVERAGSAYQFRYSDDGRGIDEDAVLEMVQKKDGREESSEESLLDILSRPGLTTADTADTDGGRGLGLDMVRHLVFEEFGSELELENTPGLGTAFCWTVPGKRVKRPYLVFVSDGRSWAIPSDSVRGRGVLDPERISASGQAYDFGGHVVPLVGPEGLKAPGTVKPYVLEICHRGRMAALLADDLVSEEPWGHAELHPADPAGPWCRSLGAGEENIPVLSPALVYAADGGY